MDIARPVNRRRKRIRRAVWASVALVGVVAFGVGLSRLNDAAPNVDAATVWVDTVKRGPYAAGRCAGWARWSRRTSAGSPAVDRRSR